MTELVRWTKKSPPSEEEIFSYFSGVGLSPHQWSNTPFYKYPVHNHPYTKVLFCLKGSIDFKIHPDGKIYGLKSGDKLVVSVGVGHSAVVGPDGITCI